MMTNYNGKEATLMLLTTLMMLKLWDNEKNPVYVKQPIKGVYEISIR